MARRLVLLALAACLGLGASACGGGDEPAGAAASPSPAPQSGTTAEQGEPAAAETQAERAAEPDAVEEPARRSRPRPRSRGRAGSDHGRTRAQVERTVRRIVGMISAADAGVCRDFFTARYAELVSDKRGEAAFRQCESDVGRSKGRLAVKGFERSRISGDRAFVRFKLEAAGTLTMQQWRMVFADGHWLVDGKR